MTIAVMNYLTDIRFGAGAVRILSDAMSQLSITRPLVVTDEGLLSLGILDRLPCTPAAVFAGVPTNPTEDAVEAGVAVFREHDCDGLVALGGGSPIDCAKAIGLATTHSGPLSDYALINGGLPRITSNMPPLIAIPTTSGTGSEVGRGALITVRGGTKLGLISPHLIPSIAICDPELTLELPPRLTAATGLDAISHCVETFCSRKVNPVADAIALDGLGRAWSSIRAAVHDPQSLHHRTEMMMASLQGGLTFQKGLGMVHSLSHPLGGLPDKPLHHGTLNAVFLPHVLRFNAEADSGKIKRMAEAMSLSTGRNLPEVFERLNQDIGLPARLSEMGVTSDDLSGIPAAAMADHSTPTNLREMTEDDCRTLLEAAL
jgi:alcohol dehydrogenase class IV